MMLPTLHSAAMYLFFESDMVWILLDEAMFPDPVLSAADAETFEAIHILMCADTGTDPAYVSVRRVYDWLVEGAVAYGGKKKAANA